MAQRIAIVGLCYGGLGALKTILQQTEAITTKLEISVIEPRSGFLNILAIPKTISDSDFAKKAFVDLNDMGIVWDNIKLIDEQSVFRYESVLKKTSIIKTHKGFQNIIKTPPDNDIKINDNITLNFIQAYVTEIRENNTLTYTTSRYIKDLTPKQFQLSNAEKEAEKKITLPFDYCVVSTGRSRNWPMDPIATNMEEFIKEMKHSSDSLKPAKNVTVIGGGALGIEVAGEVKESFPNKEVVLIHPYEHLPPEPLVPREFCTKTEKIIKETNVDLRLGVRAKENGNDKVDLFIKNKETNEMTPKGSVPSDIIYWCNYHKNNISLFKLPVLVTKEEIGVTEFLQVKKPDGSHYPNIFAAGDIIQVPIIKTAGGAYREGVVCGTNLVATILKEESCFETLGLDTWPKNSMVVMSGTHRSVLSQPTGDVVIDDPGILDMYKDYRSSQIFAFNGFTKAM